MKIKLLILFFVFIVSYSCRRQLEPILSLNTLLDSEMPQTLSFVTNATVLYNFTYSLDKIGVEYSGNITIDIPTRTMATWNVNDIRDDVLDNLNSELRDDETGIEFGPLGDALVTGGGKTVTFSLIPDPSTLPEGFENQTYTFIVTSPNGNLAFTNGATLLEVAIREKIVFSSPQPPADFNLNYSLNKIIGSDEYNGIVTQDAEGFFVSTFGNTIRDNVLSYLNDDFSDSEITFASTSGDAKVSSDRQTVEFSLMTATVPEGFENQTYRFEIFSSLPDDLLFTQN